MKSQARKKDIPHHRGRRGFFWGDPGKGYPGSSISRAAMAAQARTIERRERRAGKLACQDRED